MRLAALALAVTLLGCSGESVSELDSWPFADPRNAAVFSTDSVTRGGEPILYVSHDAEDGAWQFLGAEGSSVESAAVVALSTIVELDPSVSSLADLPLGWSASRDSCAGPWRRAKEQ